MKHSTKSLIFLSILLCSSLNFAAQEEKKEREEKVAQEEKKGAEEVVPAQDADFKKGIKPKLAYKIQLLGKLKVITKDLKQAAHSFNNKFARGLISTLVDDMEKITPAQDVPDMLKALDKITQNLNKIKDPKWVNQKELATVDNILAKIQALKNSYQKNIDLSHFKNPNEKLDLLEVEPISMEPFMELILAQQETKLPYILARVVEGAKTFYFDAHLLNQYIFNGYPIYPNASKWEKDEKDNQKMRHKKEGFGFRPTINPLNRAPLTINNIDYFTLNSLKDTEFKYLASLNDLINKQDVQNVFYKNSGTSIVLEPFKTLDSFSGNAIAISSNNKFIVTSGSGAKMWDAQTGNAIHPLVSDTFIYFSSVAISPNNQFVVAGYESFIPSSQLVASGYSANEIDELYSWGENSAHAAQIWNVQTGAVLHSLAHESIVSAIAISSDNKFVVTGAVGDAKIWNAQSGQELHKLPHAGNLFSVAISPNNKFVVTGARDSIKIWNAQTGALLHTLENEDSVNAVAISPNNKFIVAGSEKGARIWNLQTGTLVRNLSPNEGINAVAISSNNKFIVTGSSNKKAKIWNAQTGALLHTLNHVPVAAVAISSNNKFVVTGSAVGTVKIWNALTGVLLYTLENEGSLKVVAISPNNKFVVTGSSAIKTKIWEIPE